MDTPFAEKNCHTVGATSTNKFVSTIINNKTNNKIKIPVLRMTGSVEVETIESKRGLYKRSQPSFPSFKKSP